MTNDGKLYIQEDQGQLVDTYVKPRQAHLTATCPFCKEEVNHLLDKALVPAYTVFAVLLSGKAYYGDTEICDTGDSQGFICPECHELVAYHEEVARQLFTGGKND